MPTAMYVRADNGQVFVQVFDPASRFGFCLASDDQTWDGGVGALPNGMGWTVISESDVSAEDRQRLAWIVNEARPIPTKLFVVESRRCADGRWTEWRSDELGVNEARSERECQADCLSLAALGGEWAEAEYRVRAVR